MAPALAPCPGVCPPRAAREAGAPDSPGAGSALKLPEAGVQASPSKRDIGSELLFQAEEKSSELRRKVQALPRPYNKELAPILQSGIDEIGALARRVGPHAQAASEPSLSLVERRFHFATFRNVLREHPSLGLGAMRNDLKRFYRISSLGLDERRAVFALADEIDHALQHIADRALQLAVHGSSPSKRLPTVGPSALTNGERWNPSDILRAVPAALVPDISSMMSGPSPLRPPGIAGRIVALGDANEAVCRALKYSVLNGRPDALVPLAQLAPVQEVKAFLRSVARWTLPGASHEFLRLLGAVDPEAYAEHCRRLTGALPRELRELHHEVIDYHLGPRRDRTPQSGPEALALAGLLSRVGGWRDLRVLAALQREFPGLDLAAHKRDLQRRVGVSGVLLATANSVVPLRMPEPPVLAKLRVALPGSWRILLPPPIRRSPQFERAS